MAISDPAALLPLAESIADGKPIDWHDVERRASGDEQGVIRQLRVLANLAVLHRSLPATVPESSPGSAGRRSHSSPAIGNWAHLALVERLGSGTFGEVYRAWDRHLEREVALKLLRMSDAAIAPDDPQTSRIANEGRLLARVRHPNVITVHGVEIHEGRIGLCMELVRGTTLEESLRERGPFSAREAALIGIDLCRALAAIHAAGLIHRDVKAQNVMREDGGRIVLMDLGTGREIDRDGLRGHSDLAGTPLYLAPEIFDGDPASEKTDLYSLGMLLYHLVTGTFPVKATNLDELRSGHIHNIGIRLRDARPDLPTAFVRVVDRAIANDPDRRYASAGALEAGLVDALDVTAAPTPAAETPAGAVDLRVAGWRRFAAIAAVTAAAILVAVVAWRSAFRPAPPGVPGPIHSVAVLPLKNFSGDPAQEYFADGMTDELIGTLGRLGSINVISRTSVMQFKESKASLSEIAKTLHVDAVLEGSILVVPASSAAGKGGAPRVRINARLIYAGTDTQLWDRTFEKVASDVLALQSDVAKAVADGINLHLSAREQRFFSSASAVAKAGAQQFEAFDLYLKGRYYWNKRTEEDLNRSLQYFQQAIDADPAFGSAYAGLADGYQLLGVYGFVPRALAQSRAADAATKALQIDETLAEAHISLASIHDARWEWDAAGSDYRRGLELKPAYATGHHWYAIYLTMQGRFQEALTEIMRALELDPLSAGINSDYGVVLMYSRRYSDAIAQLQQSLRLNPSFGRTHVTLVDAYAHHGDYELALAEGEEARRLIGASPEVPAAIGYVHALAGRRADALEIVRDLEVRYLRSEDETAGAIASIYTALGDLDAAFEWLERSRERREYWAAYLAVDPKFDRLHSDPRFTKLVVSMGLAR